ncbi:MAG: hypothetical protein KC983_05120, partial [Phycisphaerales bacterium]|nr:hypothetical protein [Phycisphaerales bacterium]
MHDAQTTEKRRIPPFRTVFVIGVLAVIGFSIVVTLLTWAFRGDQTPVDYASEFCALVRATQGTKTNGFSDLDRAIRLVEAPAFWVNADDTSLARPKGCAYDPDGFDHAVLSYGDALDVGCMTYERAMVQRFADRGVNDLIDRAAEADVISREIESLFDPSADSTQPLWSRLNLSDLGWLRRISYVYVVAMRLAVLEDDEETYVDDLRRALTLQRAGTEQFTIVEQLVATAISSRTFGELMMQLQERRFRADTLENIAGLLNDDRICPDIRRAVDGESVFVRDVIQWLYADVNGRSVTVNLSRLNSMLTFMPPDRGMDAPMSSFGGALIESHQKTLDRLGEFEKELKRYTGLNAIEQSNDPFDPDQALQALPARQPILKLMSATWVSAIQSTQSARQTIDAARIIVAIERYRAESGELPPDLTALVPKYLEAVPTDVITGTSFMYAKTSLLSNGYALWSVGLNGT